MGKDSKNGKTKSPRDNQNSENSSKKAIVKIIQKMIMTLVLGIGIGVGVFFSYRYFFNISVNGEVSGTIKMLLGEELPLDIKSVALIPIDVSECIISVDNEDVIVVDDNQKIVGVGIGKGILTISNKNNEKLADYQVEVSLKENSILNAIKKALNITSDEQNIKSSDLLLVTELNLSGLTISNFDDLRFFKNLEKLNLNNTGLEEIYAGTETKGSKTLNVIDFVNLQELSAANNNLTNVSGVATLVNLTYLNLANNKLTDLIVHENAQIKTIDVSSNLLSIFNFEVFKSSEVINLALNKIEEVVIDSESSIVKELDLSGNLLTTFTISINKLTNIQKINLANNVYLNKYNVVSQEGSKTLRSLNLSNTAISEFAVGEYVTNLQELILENAMIETLNFLVALNSLVTLKLSSSMLKELSFNSEMPLLNEIALTNAGRIQRFEIGNSAKLNALKLIDLSNNQLVYFSIGNADLPSLKEIILTNNQLSSIEVAKRLSSLTKLDLSSNRFVGFNLSENLDAITTLIINSNNTLKTVDITRGANLRVLDFKKNTSIEVFNYNLNESVLLELNLDESYLNTLNISGNMTELRTLSLVANEISHLNIAIETNSLFTGFLIETTTDMASLTIDGTYNSVVEAVFNTLSAVGDFSILNSAKFSGLTRLILPFVTNELLLGGNYSSLEEIVFADGSNNIHITGSYSALKKLDFSNKGFGEITIQEMVSTLNQIDLTNVGITSFILIDNDYDLETIDFTDAVVTDSIVFDSLDSRLIKTIFKRTSLRNLEIKKDLSRVETFIFEDSIVENMTINASMNALILMSSNVSSLNSLTIGESAVLNNLGLIDFKQASLRKISLNSNTGKALIFRLGGNPSLIFDLPLTEYTGIKEIDISNTNGLATISGIGMITSLEVFNANNCGILANIDFIFPSRLKTLLLDSTRINNLDFLSPSLSYELERISVNRTPAASLNDKIADISVLSKTNKLIRVEFQNNVIIDISSLLPSKQSIVYLNLANNKLDDSNAAIFQEFTIIEELYVEGNRNFADFSFLLNLINTLTKLSLQSTGAGVDVVEDVVPNLIKIQWLDLRDLSLNEANLAKISKLTMPSLAYLYIKNNNFTELSAPLRNQLAGITTDFGG